MTTNLIFLSTATSPLFLVFTDDGVHLEIADTLFLTDNGKPVSNVGSVRYAVFCPSSAAVFSAVGFGDDTQMGIQVVATLTVFSATVCWTAAVSFCVFLLFFLASLCCCALQSQ